MQSTVLQIIMTMSMTLFLLVLVLSVTSVVNMSAWRLFSRRVAGSA